MIFFFFHFFFFFFFFLSLRVCLSGCVHVVHANGKALAVALFQRHSKRTGEKKRLKEMRMKEEKWSLGLKDHPLSCFLMKPFPLLSTSLFPTLLFHALSNFYFSSHFLFFSQSEVVPKARALRRRIHPPGVPSE